MTHLCYVSLSLIHRFNKNLFTVYIYIWRDVVCLIFTPSELTALYYSFHLKRFWANREIGALLSLL